MSVLNDIVNGAVEVTTAAGEYTAAKIYSLLAAVSLLLILLFLLVLFLVEPMSATLITVVLVVAAAYIITQRDIGIR